MLKDQGCRVGIVTNDQGGNLVDTNYLREHGFPVMEVTGGCFCCNFDQLTQKLAQMSKEEYPDYILAEPVGSCTDLISTIMKPIRSGFAGRFALVPLSVICDPVRVRRFLNEKDSLFPNEINYLFSKQLEEAEIIVLNKCDRLQQDEIEQMENELSSRYKGVDIQPVSARTGMGMEAWVSRVLAGENRSSKKLDIRYDTYAAAEASLGWLNFSALVSKEAGFDANGFVRKLADGIRETLKESRNEIAHLKLYMVSAANFCKLSCVSVDEDVIEDQMMSLRPSKCNLIVNIRALASPEFLTQTVRDVLSGLGRSMGVAVAEDSAESFYPGYPKPKYRM